MNRSRALCFQCPPAGAASGAGVEAEAGVEVLITGGVSVVDGWDVVGIVRCSKNELWLKAGNGGGLDAAGAVAIVVV